MLRSGSLQLGGGLTSWILLPTIVFGSSIGLGMGVFRFCFEVKDIHQMARVATEGYEQWFG